MKNFIQTGDNITVTAPATVASGDGVIVGNLFGVAVTDAASGAPVTLATKGVFSLPKQLSATFASGGVVSWSVPDGVCVAPGAGFYPVGVATAAAGNGVSVVNVRLDGVSTAAAS